MAKRAAKVPKGLDRGLLLKMYHDMLMARRLDERMWSINRIGKAPFVISCQGQEAAQVGWAAALTPEDLVVPYYRDLGVMVWRGMTAREAMLGLLGKAGDPSSNGRQMPGHYGSKRLGVISGSSVVMDHILHATGIAYAIKAKGERLVAAAAFGEGSTAQGDFHEALNWASIYRLPALFICENNRYAISVPQDREMAVENVSDRARAYNMPGVSVDGMDVLAVYEATLAAAERARDGDGPTLLEFKAYRLLPHSSDDDDRTYRSREEVDTWRSKDPIPRFAKELVAMGIWSGAEDEALKKEIQAEVDEAAEYADEAPYPPVEELGRYVYAEEGDA